VTDGMARLMKDQTFTAVEYKGVTDDCGDKIGLLRAKRQHNLEAAGLGLSGTGGHNCSDSNLELALQS